MDYPIIEERCGNCRWYNPTNIASSYWNGATAIKEVKSKGQCRRNPPAPLIPGGASTPKTWWPEVTDIEWCGEYAKVITEEMEVEVTEWASVQSDEGQ